MLLDSLTSLPVICVIAVVVVIVLFLLMIWALARTKGVGRTRFGFYIERERFTPPEYDWPERPGAEQDTLILTPKKPTQTQ